MPILAADCAAISTNYLKFMVCLHIRVKRFNSCTEKESVQNGVPSYLIEKTDKKRTWKEKNRGKKNATPPHGGGRRQKILAVLLEFLFSQRLCVPLVDQLVIDGVTGPAFHNVRLGLFVREGNGRDLVSAWVARSFRWRGGKKVRKHVTYLQKKRGRKQSISDTSLNKTCLGGCLSSVC